MHRGKIARMLIISGAVALGAACGRDGSGTSITVSGCLQRGSNGRFLLTRVNEPEQKNVGTTGSNADVEREQLRQAWATYQITPIDTLRLDQSVGKEITIVGVVKRDADFPKAKAQESADARADIDQKDVTSVKATSASVVAETCKGPESAGASKSGAN